MKSIVCLTLIAILAIPVMAGAQQDRLTLDQAVQRVKSQGNARVLSAETIEIDGRSVHRIKVLTDAGRVKYIQVDPGG